MAYNKIIYNGSTLIDLTADDVAPQYVLSGKIFHGADGDSATGTMNNRGAATGTLASKDDSYTIQAGYHNGSGKVTISDVQKALLIPGNIKNGVTLMGVTGTYSGEGPNLQTKSVSYTPAATAQTATVTPAQGYDGLSSVSVTIAAIPYTETANTYGTTVTIG